MPFNAVSRGVRIARRAIQDWPRVDHSRRDATNHAPPDYRSLSTVTSVVSPTSVKTGIRTTEDPHLAGPVVPSQALPTLVVIPVVSVPIPVPLSASVEVSDVVSLFMPLLVPVSLMILGRGRRGENH